MCGNHYTTHIYVQTKLELVKWWSHIFNQPIIPRPMNNLGHTRHHSQHRPGFHHPLRQNSRPHLAERHLCHLSSMLPTATKHNPSSSHIYRPRYLHKNRVVGLYTFSQHSCHDKSSRLVFGRIIGSVKALYGFAQNFDNLLKSRTLHRVQ
ncbi:hypothetical protein Hanom_Chr10g00923431 [Helianthus anomalus]